MSAPKTRLLGCTIDALRLEGAVQQLLDWSADAAAPCRYVVTPNVNHVVLLEHHRGLQAAYADAAMVLADGTPLVLASRLLRRGLPERVAGSDLVPALLAAANAHGTAEEAAELRVFLLGAMPGVAVRAAENIRQRWPHVRVVGTLSPPLGFEHDDAENEKILSAIADARPNVLVVGLGAPKQELWVHAHRGRLTGCVVLCAGAAIDFLAGEKPRAPRWMRAAGIEWLHRIASEPRRLVGRYWRDARVFPRLLWRELRAGS